MQSAHTTGSTFWTWLKCALMKGPAPTGQVMRVFPPHSSKALDARALWCKTPQEMIARCLFTNKCLALYMGNSHSVIQWINNSLQKASWSRSIPGLRLLPPAKGQIPKSQWTPKHKSSSTEERRKFKGYSNREKRTPKHKSSSIEEKRKFKGSSRREKRSKIINMNKLLRCSKSLYRMSLFN